MLTYKEARAFYENISSSGIVLGTKPMLNLLNRLNNPQNQLKFVHIAGTNGKGSTLAFISTIISQAGYKVGRYSSPRVYEYEEFVQINGENISKEDFCKFTEPVKKAIEEIEKAGEPVPTVFEAETALGMLYFAKNHCDVVVLECGLGGRDDATNVLDTVVCNVITSIGLDHTKFLGDTLGKIAKVKAGIIRDDAPVVICAQGEEVIEVVREEANDHNALFIVTNPEEIHPHKEMELSCDNRPMMGFDYKDLKNLKVGLLGRYQLKNATVAIEVAKVLTTRGFKISKEQIKEGLEKTVWKGRFETIANHPQVVVDGAHNPHGVVQLKESVEYYFKNKKIFAIMGVLADKNFDKEAQMMAPFFEKVFTVTPPNNPRALQAEKLAQCVGQYHSDVTPCNSLKEAVESAYQYASEEDVILIFGSLSYLGEIMREVEEYNK
ncbi:Dihydrofolate synthase / Folylpolyglutamate synthase [Lachnospiraceae bacterium TWA4]|nr:Dihydrofolate synthase / Folylpolyglutamate synthase [Lachnospiraceae bacterium TWA4]